MPVPHPTRSFRARRRPRGGTRRTALALAGALSASLLIGVTPAEAAPLQIEDINPDASVIAQGRNNSSGGRVNGLKVVPGGNQVAYAASEWGGIFKTTNGAQTWSHLGDHEPQATFDVDVDPSATDTVYATSLYDGRVDSLAGISVSYDAGATWTHPTVPDTSPGCGSWDEPSAFGIGVVPDDPSTVVIGTSCGVAVTHNAGSTWSHVDPNPATGRRRIWDVVAQAGGIVDICGRDGHFRSTDGGDTWTNTSLGDRSGVCSIAASPLESDVLFVTQNNVALWETSDAGASWTMLEDRPGNRRAFVVTNQTGPNGFDLYFGGGPKLRYVAGCDDTTVPTRCPAAADLTDGATYGVDITGDAHDDAGDLEFDPTDPTPACPYLYSTDGGVYRSDDCTPTWVRAMVGLHDTWLFDFDAGPLPGNQTGLHFGQMDSGRWYSTDGGATWGGPNCCDIWDVVADADRVIFTICCPTTRLFSAPANDPSNITQMTPPPSGWLQWFQQTDSIQPFAPDSYVFVTQTGGNALFDPPGGNGPGGIWITEDAMTTYTQLGQASTPANACSVEVAVSGGVPTFYVLTDDNLNGNPRGLCSGGGGSLFKYTGTAPGGTWTAADAGLTTVGIFGVDPNDPDRLYASDLTGSGPRMVSSSDGGASWTPDPALDALMTGDGEFKYQNSFGPEVRWFTPPTTGYAQPTMVAYHPTNADVLVAGANDAGLFMSTDGGGSWALITDSLPRVWHPDFDPFDDSVLYVGTVGRGLWKITLPDADVSIAKADDADPAVAGEQLTYTLTVTNDGPDEAPNVRVVDTLPEGTQHVSDDAGCAEAPARVLTCELGTLANGETREIEITVDIDADLVHLAGQPVTITDTATVATAAIDPDPSDNAATEDTLVVAEADLELLSITAIDPPAELTIGEPQNVVVREVITNHGPSAPMDTRVDRIATATANAAVNPGASSELAPALALDEARIVEETYEVACEAPGPATFTFDTTISPDRPDDTDPDPSNNDGMTSFSVECIVPVAINIKPGSFTNPVNLKSKGSIPVAVLTTEAGEYGLPLAFDAAEIQPLTARFAPEAVVIAGGGAFEKHGKGHLEDALERSDEMTLDGDLDMVLHFRTQESALTGTEVEACVRGLFTANDWVFHGCDVVSFVP